MSGLVKQSDISSSESTNCIKPVENLWKTFWKQVLFFAVPFGASSGTQIKLLENSPPLRVIGSLFPGLCFSYSD